MAAPAAVATVGRLEAVAREALDGAEAAALLDRLARVAARATELHDAVAADPPEQIGRLIAEARAGHRPGKAERVAALAQRLSAARRAQGRLEALTARLERALAEMDGASQPDLAALRAALDDLDPAAEQPAAS